MKETYFEIKETIESYLRDLVKLYKEGKINRAQLANMVSIQIAAHNQILIEELRHLANGFIMEDVCTLLRRHYDIPLNRFREMEKELSDLDVKDD